MPCLAFLGIYLDRLVDFSSFFSQSSYALFFLVSLFPCFAEVFCLFILLLERINLLHDLLFFFKSHSFCLYLHVQGINSMFERTWAELSLSRLCLLIEVLDSAYLRSDCCRNLVSL